MNGDSHNIFPSESSRCKHLQYNDNDIYNDAIMFHLLGGMTPHNHQPTMFFFTLLNSVHQNYFLRWFPAAAKMVSYIVVPVLRFVVARQGAWENDKD